MLVAICLRLCSHGNAAGHALRMGCCHVGVACETACRTECWQLRCRPCATMHVARVTFLLLTLEFEFKLLSSFTFPHLSPMTKMRLWVFIVSFEPIDGVGCGSVFCGPWLVHLLLSLSDPVRAIRRQDKSRKQHTAPSQQPSQPRRDVLQARADRRTLAIQAAEWMCATMCPSAPLKSVPLIVPLERLKLGSVWQRLLLTIASGTVTRRTSLRFKACPC